MSHKNTIVGILLSLILGLSTTISIAHSHLYHDSKPSYNDHGHLGQHASGCEQNDVNSHNDHNESDCVFTVVQYTDSLLTQIIPADSRRPSSSKKTAFFIGEQIPQSTNGFFARAPPQRL
jgi:hypothetical protein